MEKLNVLTAENIDELTFWVNHCKSKLLDINPMGLDFRTIPAEYSVDIAQLKYDGWWSIACLHDSQLDIFSVSGTFMTTIYSKQQFIGSPIYIIGEYMWGTNWSLSNNLTGRFYAHDMYTNAIDAMRAPVSYATRQYGLNDIINAFSNPLFKPVETFAASEAEWLWDKYVVFEGYEGLVFKNSASRAFGKANVMWRMKKQVEMDYVCMGFNEGKGRLAGTLGSLEAGLIIDNQIRSVSTVGGGFTDRMRSVIWNNQQEYLGKVFTATGKQQFDSGAMRHPAFKTWRPDKRPDECIFQIKNK